MVVFPFSSKTSPGTSVGTSAAGTYLKHTEEKDELNF